MTSLRAILRAQVRTILPVGIVVVVGVVFLLILAVAYAELIGVTLYSTILASVATGGAFSDVVIAVLAPLLLLALFASLVWAGAAVQAADAAAGGRRTSMVSAVWTAVKKSPKALAVIVVTVAAVLGAILIAPLLTIAGLIGLLLDKPARRSRIADHWPSRGTLIAMAIPFGGAVLALVRWSLALSGVWLRKLGVRAALADSSQRVRGRGAEVAMIFVLSFGVSFVISQLAVALLAPIFGGPYAQVVVQLVALILIGALPLTTLAVLARRKDDDRSSPLAVPTTRRARVAAAVVASLIIPFVIVGVPASASATSNAVTVTADSDHTVAGEEVTLTAEVTGNSPTGSVTFDAIPTSGPDVNLGTQSIDATGKSVLQVYHIPVGTYGIVVQYAGDGNNPAANSAPLAHTVNYASTTLDVTANPTWTAAATTLTMTVSAVAPAFLAPTGTVTVSGNGHTYGPVALTSLDVTHPGVATLPIDVTTIGTRDLTVTYSGDDAYATKSTSFAVPKIPTTTNVGGETSRGATYGDSQTFNGSVTAADHSIPTGTVNLIWYNDAVVASTTLDASGNFSITTDNLRVSSQNIFLQYVGDGSHAGSDNSTSGLIHLDVNKYTSVPVVSVDPLTPAIGSSVDLTATVADVGDGPSGTVTFTDQDSQVIGTAPVSGGEASLTFNAYAPTTRITAAYSGDINFTPTTSAQYQMDATPAGVAVSLTDPGDLTYGQVFDLTATVSVGGGAVTPDHGIDFTTSGGSVIDSAVPLIAGKATFTACAGIAADCPAGTVALGASDTGIIATYAATAMNQLGQSAAYDYEPGKATTSTSLTVTPSPTVIYGSAVFLVATVTATNSALTPTGSVTFYGVEPGVGGSTSLDFLGTGELVDGVALLTTSHANGTDQLRWPANQVEAFYSPDGNFKSSTDVQSVTLDRVGVTLDVSATPGPAGTNIPITVALSHDPGVNDDYTGKVVVTATTGETCTVFPHTGQHQVTCDLNFATGGGHGVTATYSGDDVYEPSTSDPYSFGSTKGTPALGATVVGTGLVGTDVTVTWGQFDPTATGTVTVWGGGTQWCSVSVQALSCSGQFTDASATDTPAPIVVQYTGDANWNPIEQDRAIFVSRCAALDVRSTDTSLGTVRVNTASNCGAGGYIAGTTISVTATVIAPAVFYHWLKYDHNSGNLVPDATTTTTSFVVTNDDLTWVHEAVFEVPCETITASATGYGGLSITPSSNCTTHDGDPGYFYGTKVAIYPAAHYDPAYGELDAFRSFGALPPGATLNHDRWNDAYVALTVKVDTVVPLAFGPQCRPVTVLFNPASTGDSSSPSTPLNCFSPFGDGYLNGTKVTTTVQPGDSTLAIASWSLNGNLDVTLGTTSTPTVVVENVAPVLTANLVHCYVVDATTDNVTDTRGRVVGDVRVDGPPNCPDGSERYLAGTTVTLTPEVLVSGGAFDGWDDTKAGPIAPAAGTGDVPQGIRTFPITADVHTKAGFYLSSACSRLTIIGPTPTLLGFDNTGCGPGYYADIQKQAAINDNVNPTTLWQGKYHAALTAKVDRTQPLDVYVSVKGDTRGCFGTVPSSAGPSTDDPNQWKTYGPILDSASTCNIAGNTTVWPQACETLTTTPIFAVDGDASGATYDASAFPGSFYLEGPDGQVHGYTMDGFNWAQLTPLGVDSNGNATVTELPPGPCHDAGSAFPAHTYVSLKAVGPATGFSFSGWTGTKIGGLITANPFNRYTFGTERSLSTTVYYTVKCYTIALGEGLTAVGDVPRCPGSSPSDNSYIAGTAVQIKAVQHIGDRILEKFTSGVVASQISEDPDTKELTAYAVVDGNKSVSAAYLTNGQFIGTGILQGLKVSAGVFAVAAPIVLGMMFPPAGILFSVLGAASGLASQIPGGGTAAAVFDLLNPTNITVCAARWSFNNSGDPAGGANIGSAISLANTMRKLNNGTDLVGEPVGPVGAGGGLLSFGYGLYSNGIAGAQLGPTTVDSLADSSTMTNCLNDQWRVAGSDIGKPASSPSVGG